MRASSATERGANRRVRRRAGGGPHSGAARRAAARFAVGVAAAAVAGCAGAAHDRDGVGTVRYVGSSTVAKILRSAEPVYGRLTFELDTDGESTGGEAAMLAGRADLAGVANHPRPETLRASVVTTLVGRDAIAVLVNAANPVTDLTREQLQGLFTGAISDWSELGGPELAVRPLAVGEESATHLVFRDAVLDGRPLSGCRIVRPDSQMVAAVAADPGAIGQISFSFMRGAAGVRAVAVDGQEPSVTNFDYPISRPLFLLWREGDAAVERFVTWLRSPAGQSVVMKQFVGVRVLGSVRAVEPPPPDAALGQLVVYTETFAVYDGGLYYYPHLSYEVRDREGRLVRRVRNHRGENDENPTPVPLPPGTYLIRSETSRGEPAEFFVAVEAGRTTTVDVEELLAARP